MPTAASTTWTGQRLDPKMDPENALVQNVQLAASTTYARGTVIGELTATPGTFKAYASGNSDGSQVPKGVLQYDYQTDGSGNITLGTGTTGNQFGQFEQGAAMYFAGTFDTTLLTGLDANAITVMGARFVSGILAAGVIRFG